MADKWLSGGTSSNRRSAYLLAAIAHFYRVLKFALVSGIGLAIDFAVFLILLTVPLAPLTANLASGAVAVTFVYFASVKRIFRYEGGFLFGLFAAYVLYQVMGVTAVSFAVDYLSRHYVAPAVAKLLILPVTFSANYLFMFLLTRTRRRGDDTPVPPAG